MIRERGPVRRALAGVAAALLVSASLVALTATPAAAATPAPNPEIPAQCGLAVTLVLDASGSVQSSNAVGAVRSAAESFLDAFQDTGSTARVLQFASLSEQLAARAQVTTASMQTGGVFREAISDYYNPIPPRPADVEIKRFNSGNPASAGSWQSANSNNQYTNWDQSLNQTSTDAGDLVVYITDGDPTAYDFNQPGDPFSPGPPPDVGVGTDRNSTVAAITLDRAVQRANQVKATGARVLALGVGEALQNDASVNRLTQISGPDVARSIAEFDLATTDVALIADFDDLADAVRALVLDLCSPSLTIRKFAQTASNATYQPADGWDMTVTPTVAGGFGWILPTGATGADATVTTANGGFAQFQWEPNDPDVTSSALVEEDIGAKPGYTPGRPGLDNDYRCEFKNADGDVRIVSGELTAGGTTASFDIDPIGNEIGTCAVYNSFTYAPAIELTKVNTPTSVRGDLTPPAVVRSSYVVTNPGNTPLSNVAGADDKCAPVLPVTQAAPNQAYNIGDTDRDRLLDTTESWQFFCDREMRTSGTRAFGGLNVVNTATVRGTDPAGTVVNDSAADDVDVFVPGITLTKLVNGQESVTVTAGTTVTYTYRAANTGNTPLSPVTLVDDTPPCTAPIRGADAIGNGDAVMDVGEAWTWSCTAAPTASVVNTATVTGTPIDPTTGIAFPDPNPVVRAADTAEVKVVVPGLTLTKSVDESVVFPGTVVTYTYDATNTGTADLRNDTGNPGWVTDDRCAPVQPVPATGFNAGDVNSDSRMNPGETWQFTCQSVILVATTNTATIVAQPIDAGGNPVDDPLTRTDVAFVDVVHPGIELTKTALVPVVLDPDAEPVSGPDVPDVMPAQYLYEVKNTGTVPLRDVAPTDDRCAPLVFVDGDVDGDGDLQVDEVWTYTCETTLEREQGTPTPIGAESGLVTNTATVTGVPFLSTDPDETGPTQTDTATAQVLVIEPSIAITKTPSATVVKADSDVTYTFEVTNTGDVGLEVIGPSDDKCAPLTYVRGDINGNGILEGANAGGAETWVYTCTRAVPLPTAPDTSDINEASVQGVDPLGNIYEANATAEVTVLDPAIDLVKTASDHLVLVGSVVDYTFEVTNVGESPIAADDVLAQVILADVAVPALPSCSTPTLVSKTGGNQDDLLDRDPFETWTYECSATINAPTTNLAVVRAVGGTQFGLSLPVFAFDAERVQTFDPAIDITKTADPTRTVKGGAVTYTYQVINTGDVPLANVAERIADDTCSPVSYVSGDEDGDGLLDTPNSIFEDSLDETWIFTCSTTVDETTTNTVIVSGTAVDPTGVELCDAAEEPAPDAIVPLVSLDTEPTCEPSAMAQATVVVGPPLPPTGGQLSAAALGIGAMLVALGILLMRARRLRLPGA